MKVLIVGAGPAGLTCAAALSMRDIECVVYDKMADPMLVNTQNADRAYPVDISGHGMNGINHIAANEYFEKHCDNFLGIRGPNLNIISKNKKEDIGYMGSRTDIAKALLACVRNAPKSKKLVKLIF